MFFWWRKTVLHLFRSHWQSAAIQMHWQVYHVKSKRFCLSLLSMARWAFQCNCEPGFDEHKCQHCSHFLSFGYFWNNKHKNRRDSMEKVAITKGFGRTRFWQLTCDLKCLWWSWLGNLRFPLHRKSPRTLLMTFKLWLERLFRGNNALFWFNCTLAPWHFG